MESGKDVSAHWRTFAYLAGAALLLALVLTQAFSVIAQDKGAPVTATPQPQPVYLTKEQANDWQMINLRLDALSAELRALQGQRDSLMLLAFLRGGATEVTHELKLVPTQDGRLYFPPVVKPAPDAKKQ
jgi:hypothetical protein